MQSAVGAGLPGVPGQQKQPALSDAQRGAEALFTTKTISEIREIEVRTRKDIEQKKLQLRNLVGDSYRDLIDSADKILAIANNTTTILQNVRTIQESFTSLAHNFTSSDALLNEKRDSLTKHEELYAVGSRIKYLVDTPELIWGCLDAARYLEAARRFLRAQAVHDLLPAGFSSPALARFPLLRHHWPTVTKFQKQIVESAQAALANERQLPTALAVDLLAALAALQGVDAAALLQAFLAARRTMIAQVASSAAAAASADGAAPEQPSDGASSAPAKSAEVLAAVAQAAQLTIAQVGEIFLASSGAAAPNASGAGGGADASCLLQQRCREEETDFSELLFGGRTTSSAGGPPSAHAPEADAWKRTNRSILDRLAALSSGQVEHACVAWLRAVAEDFAGQSSALLAGLTSASELVEVEAQVRAAIAGWEHPGAAAARTAAAAAGAKRPRFAHPASASALQALSAPGVPAAGAGAAAAASAPHFGTWEAVSEWVVGRQLNVWQEMFHQPFVVRSRELVEASFAAAALLLVGTADAASWPPGVHSTPVSASPSSAHLARAGSEATGSGLLSSSYSGPHHRSSLHALSAIKRDMQGSRSAELEPFVQARCMELVTSIASKLQARLDALGTPREGPEGAQAAEQLVLLGRLASALAADSRYLPVVLGPPEAWKAAASASVAPGAGLGSGAPGRPTGRGTTARGGAAASARLSSVLEKLRSAAVAAYRKWAAWAAVSLGNELGALLLADDLLNIATVPLSWQETVIASEAENALAEPMADMRFSLPASPSPSVLLLLAAACAEVRRAGDHKIAPEALQVFEWELSRAITSTYMQLLAPGPGGLQARGLSEKGVLQLLFDVRLVRDVLLGGRPVGSAGPSAAGAGTGQSAVRGVGVGGLLATGAVVGAGAAELADPTVLSALAERKRQQAALEQTLQDMLDPIDWATYESHLWANEVRYFQRVAILFGGLIQLQRAHPEAPAKLAAPGLQDANPLNVLPVAARFQYLPISAPAPANSSQQAGSAANGSSMSLASSRMRAAASMGALNRAMQGSLAGDASDSYSFADLGASRLGRGGAGAAAGSMSAAEAAPTASQLGGAAASVGAAALSALQSRLQGNSFSTFGSLLGDKAAEVTAMAQQRFGDFGDYLPTSALGSAAGGLLSSLAKNVVKK
ncbi:hypothetical protein GPECTOR_23g103 [Gonium pectorale]|uniref:Conserved oligomeric Golgi complex subunit 1 n=1 Tax=Gonium pectorale TaxID=33097 RepID=A0A150GGS0_GONPE|nr:hypothetical protein GPECTOR_23g103 [Gonium pectorale]|eukprot:KXZ49014.1 hypothetical protein GPECTOR_23g103 [Gonium pectorale]